MNENLRNVRNGANRFLTKFGIEKKKSLLAVCLIVVMAFMWIRVLSGDKPKSAKASAQSKKENSQSDSQVSISFIELPEIPGRNDVITRDCFASEGWRDFVKKRQENLNNSVEVGVVSIHGGEGVVAQVAQKINLQAIVMSENPQAFINDKLLSVGDTFIVKDATDVFQCEVVKIHENTVVIECEQAQVTLKLTREIEVTD